MDISYPPPKRRKIENNDDLSPEEQERRRLEEHAQLNELLGQRQACIAPEDDEEINFGDFLKPKKKNRASRVGNSFQATIPPLQTSYHSSPFSSQTTNNTNDTTTIDINNNNNPPTTNFFQHTTTHNAIPHIIPTNNSIKPVGVPQAQNITDDVAMDDDTSDDVFHPQVVRFKTPINKSPNLDDELLTPTPHDNLDRDTNSDDELELRSITVDANLMKDIEAGNIPPELMELFIQHFSKNTLTDEEHLEKVKEDLKENAPDFLKYSDSDLLIFFPNLPKPPKTSRVGEEFQVHNLPSHSVPEYDPSEVVLTETQVGYQVADVYSDDQLTELREIRLKKRTRQEEKEQRENEDTTINLQTLYGMDIPSEDEDDEEDVYDGHEETDIIAVIDKRQDYIPGDDYAETKEEVLVKHKDHRVEWRYADDLGEFSYLIDSYCEETGLDNWESPESANDSDEAVRNSPPPEWPLTSTAPTTAPPVASNSLSPRSVLSTDAVANSPELAAAVWPTLASSLGGAAPVASSSPPPLHMPTAAVVGTAAQNGSAATTVRTIPVPRVLSTPPPEPVISSQNNSTGTLTSCDEISTPSQISATELCKA